MKKKTRRSEAGVVSTEYVLMLVVVSLIVAGLVMALKAWGIADHLVAMFDRALTVPS